jgi:hypothetical protein
MSEKYYLPWSDDRDSLVWSGGEIDWVWKDVFVLIDVAASVNMGGYLPDDHTWDWLEKKLDKKTLKEFERIVIKVNGLEKIKKKNEPIKITVAHIKKTFDSAGIPIKIGVSFDKDKPEEDI